MNHGIVDGPTVHTSPSPEARITDMVDELPPPLLDHHESTAWCTRHTFSCSALAESRVRYSHVRRRSDGLL